MRIDRTQRKWANASGIILAIAVLSYVPYAYLSRPRGGSWPGLIYGIVGLAFMIFVALLSLRKRFPTWRMGRSQTWMRGHLWLGFIAYPIILLHAGFSLGGSVTTWLMILFTFVVLSGIAGAAIQHYMPNMMTRAVPYETIYDQIDNVIGQLVEESQRIMEQMTPTIEAMPVAEINDRTIRFNRTMVKPAERVEVKPFKEFYEEKVLPYLQVRGRWVNELGNADSSRTMFSQLKKMSPPDVGSLVDDLENICDEKRQLDLQSRLHRILHGWLLFHIPLSWALLALACVHAVIALRY